MLGDSNTAHLTRDGALGLVVAIAALLASWRPHWTRPSFAIASAAVIAQAAASALDNTAATGDNELIHLPSVALACLTGALAIRLTTLTPRNRSSVACSGNASDGRSSVPDEAARPGDLRQHSAGG